jgi:hypothetical protein
MNVCIVKEDKVVMIDGEGLNFDFDLPSNVWAIQWNGSTGEIEFNDGTPNEVITDFSAYQSLVDGHATEKQRLADVATQEATDAEAALTYADRRKAKYDALNQFEMQFDDATNSTTTWVDAINAIKAEFPKP